MRFVLVHGAWHGGWCFEALARELAACGHGVSAPDLPCDDISQDQHDYARGIGPQPDAIVVGHSLGGLTIPFVEAAAHVYLAAILPLEDVWDGALLESFGGFLRDEQGRSYWPDLETTRRRMFPDCTDEQAAHAFPRLRPQAPIQPSVSGFGPDDVYITCRHDAAVDPAWQARAAHEHFGRVVELDTGHSPFFTGPAELAELLVSLF
jgi:pimeloyl-ACP methyl ester carboxylesterase